jgi:hypothetical protein
MRRLGIEAARSGTGAAAWSLPNVRILVVEKGRTDHPQPALARDPDSSLISVSDERPHPSGVAA